MASSRVPAASTPRNVAGPPYHLRESGPDAENGEMRVGADRPETVWVPRVPRCSSASRSGRCGLARESGSATRLRRGSARCEAALGAWPGQQVLEAPHECFVMSGIEAHSIESSHQPGRSSSTGRWTSSPSGTSPSARELSNLAGDGPKTSSRSPAPTPAEPRHTGICVSGGMTVRMDDGTETTIGPET